MAGVFSTLPENFFSPLASVNREHYAAMLVLYYRLFQENSRGIDREHLLRCFTDYVSANKDAFKSEDDSDVYENNNLQQEKDEDFKEDRSFAGRFLRRLIYFGWLSEETLKDYTRVINIAPYARPFFEALAHTEEGLRAEYESHVVAIYSLLCGDAVAENGHYAVLNAHNSTTALIDSLKVLSQSIKQHYERFGENAENSIAEILHLHYDIYSGDILDAAYKRLKTSDNLSRYRPRIIRKVGELLTDQAWLSASAQKLAHIQASTIADAKQKIEIRLEEIRDTLRAVDPLLEDIDRRNMLYARASIERVKALLEPDSTISGKIAFVLKNIKKSHLWKIFSHNLFGIRILTQESLYKRRKAGINAPLNSKVKKSDPADLAAAEAQLRKRLEKQLSSDKICKWLDEQGGTSRLLSSADLLGKDGSFVNFVYSVLYADSRSRFEYSLEDNEKTLETENYIVPHLTFRKKR
ncbi:MAG: DUF5716 family protein [Spirochaetaceae bacterium]|jgi:uncharacterized protein with ACT and thioredoxin-like domain|nr:DUF5716 family protein [Spirochaetaceae bacterium]